MTHRTVIALFAALVLAFAWAQEDGPLPQGPGVDLVYGKCQQCHPINYTVSNAGLPDFLWADTIQLMKQLGMQVTEEEEEILFEYLTTYLGTEPPPEPPEASADDAPETMADVDGAQVYATSCASCHGAEGAGVPGGFPPLAGHAADLAAADRSYLVDVLLYGLNGQITVDGTSYNGVMPGWQQLSDASLAAVLNHVVIAWDEDGALPPDFDRYAPEDVAEARGRDLGPRDVLERRPSVP
ncbi:MAG: cytochrome c [Trueperaceae bacterium]|nr:cytochrome c [Trueperaceae bacterium]